MKDLTFGQYMPFNSFLHKLDPRIKLLLTLGLIVVAFVSFNFFSLGLVALFTVCAMIISKVPISFYLRSLKAIWFFVLLTAVLNIFYIKGERLLASFWIFNIYSEAIVKAIFIAVRIVLLIFISSMLTYTTAPTELTDGIERLLSPLQKLGVDTHMFAMMMTIAIRFIPTLIEETNKIMSAQKSRGSNMENGSIIGRIKAVIPILIPLLISSVRRAKELADAMECRCYHGGIGRTRMKQLKMGRRDLISFFTSLCLLSGVIALNILF
ncbi:MAG: energy-coupling factor transporter transmembrane protein EcfT [Acutalibacteraceae bacterium]|nr:energy-coupling factor transporter transmembrane protein EcfT [Acutalibacteraceae bacterium]